MEKAKEALKEGTSLVWLHIKLIRFVDKSEFGWEMVNQYEADELASNSEDDKRIYCSERRAKKKHEEKKKKEISSHQIKFFLHQYVFSHLLNPSPPTEVCCDRPWVLLLLAKFGHHQTKCPLRAVFPPTSLDVAKPRSKGWILACVQIQISVFFIVLFSAISNVSFSSEGLPGRFFSARSFWISTLSSPLFVQNIVTYGYTLQLKAFPASSFMIITPLSIQILLKKLRRTVT